MKSCIACSMPLVKPEDMGPEVESGQICVHCVDENGKMRSCEDIFEGGVQFFLTTVADGDRELAERITRKNMKSLPHWQNNPCECLNGDVASNEEFGAAMVKLQSNK